MGIDVERMNWLNERKKGIGGSDAAVILGLSKWKSPYQLYIEKTGETQEEETPVIEWGKRLEPVIRQKYCDITQQTVYVPGEDKILVHPAINYMLASLDGIVSTGKVFEAKNSRLAYLWGDPGTDQIPEEYLVQVQHYMAVTGLEVADVAVLINGFDFRIYEVPADKNIHEVLFESQEKFWEGVVNRTPPEPRTLADMKHKFGQVSRPQKVQATDEVLAALGRLKLIKEAAKEEDELKALIFAHMKESDTLINGDFILATYKATKPGKRFDGKNFQTEYPDLYEKYTYPTPPTRRFLIK